MAQTLKYGEEILASFPDNTSQLITPVMLRDMLVSVVNGRGYLSDTTTITLPMTSGVPVLVNPLLVGVTSALGMWGLDGNNLFFPNHAVAIPTTVIPPGYTKLVSLTAVLSLDNSAAGDDQYDIQFMDGATPLGQPFTIEIAPRGAESTLVTTHVLIPLDGSHQIGVQITPLDSDNDLLLHSFEMAVSDALIISDPAP